MSKKNKIFTLTEIEQIEAYIAWADKEAAYYGRKDYFKKRRASILEKLGKLREEYHD